MVYDREIVRYVKTPRVLAKFIYEEERGFKFNENNFNHQGAFFNKKYSVTRVQTPAKEWVCFGSTSEA